MEAVIIDFLEKIYSDSFSWIEEEKKTDEYREYFMKIPKYLHCEKFFNALAKLPIENQKYLLRIETRGSKKGVKKALPIEGKKFCKGELCRGKYQVKSEMNGSYCNECNLYIGLFSFKAIIENLKKHSCERAENQPNNSKVGYVSPYIGLEIYFKLVEQGGMCAITNEKMIDFTGFLDSNRPKNLNVGKVFSDDFFILAGENHWSPDRICKDDGYYFDNIQLVRRVVNECKGKLEKLSLKELTSESYLCNVISNMHLKMFSVFEETFRFVLVLKINKERKGLIEFNHKKTKNSPNNYYLASLTSNGGEFCETFTDSYSEILSSFNSRNNQVIKRCIGESIALFPVARDICNEC
ncbi:hypothetical protein [Lysinibacillus xylanilyticus]|uniref:Uncharacterized protein n=1 Tax=Lysinibacillus xylanilyticus TaxID=582475 RepID=A0ABV3W015_9BACI